MLSRIKKDQKLLKISTGERRRPGKECSTVKSSAKIGLLADEPYELISEKLAVWGFHEPERIPARDTARGWTFQTIAILGEAHCNSSHSNAYLNGARLLTCSRRQG
jgi:hypothetical protein